MVKFIKTDIMSKITAEESMLRNLIDLHSRVDKYGNYSIKIANGHLGDPLIFPPDYSKPSTYIAIDFEQTPLMVVTTHNSRRNTGSDISISEMHNVTGRLCANAIYQMTSHGLPNIKSNVVSRGMSPMLIEYDF